VKNKDEGGRMRDEEEELALKTIYCVDLSPSCYADFADP